MKSRRVKLGDFIEQLGKKCGKSNLTIYDVSGINRDKEFFEPSKQVGQDTSNYKIVPPNYFACNLMHIGRDVVLPIALNITNKDKYVSPAYTVFKITDENIILSKYLFMLLKSCEKDRYFWFHCDSSVRDGMDWDTFCDVEIEIPPIEIQKKYVDVYESLLHNLKVYESKLEDLKLICDGYIEDTRRKEGCLIGDNIYEVNNKNLNKVTDIEMGVSINKEFIPTKAKSSNIENQKLVENGMFAYNSNTSRNSATISLALNDSMEQYAVSNTYVTFKCLNSLNPKYLNLWFKRKEFDRFARFNSWGSARETIGIEELKRTKISIPNNAEQEAIVNIFAILIKRKQYIKRLKELMQRICPILIKGSIEECR